MISMGGIIGAGLFVGSSAPISAVGPAVVVSYLIAGLLILLVMRMLAEMACALPGVRTFTEFARAGLGPGAGFTVGWLYWYFWVIVVPVEAIAGAQLLHVWVQLVPAWQFGVALIAVMTGVNLMSARSYGEFEFWFASIKVAAIIVFIALAAAAATGLLARGIDVRANLFAHGGLMPHGLLAVLAGVTSVFFSLTGAEITTVAAAESKRSGPGTDAHDHLGHHTHTVVLRRRGGLDRDGRAMGSDRAAAVALHARVTGDAVSVGGNRDERGDPHRGAVLSQQRVLCDLARTVFARRAQRCPALAGAPQSAARTRALGADRCGCRPARHSGRGQITGGVFAFLVNASGALILFVYLITALAQIRLRRGRDARALPVRMWWFPWASYAAVAGMLAVLVAMALTRALASQFYVSLGALALALLAYALMARYRRRRGVVAQP